MATKNLVLVRSLISNKQMAWQLMRSQVTQKCPQLGRLVPSSGILGQSPFSRYCLSLDLPGLGSRSGKPFPAHRCFSTVSTPQKLCLSSLRSRSLCHHHGSFLGQDLQLWGRTCLTLTDMNKRHLSSLSYANNRKNNKHLVSGLTSCDPFLECDPTLLSQWRRYRSHVSHHSSDKSHKKDLSGAGSGGSKKTLDTEVKKDETTETTLEADGTVPDPAKSLTLYQRFKKTYKEHGKVLVVVHLITSAVWFGSFYTAARCGVDIVPYLESWNLSEKVISPFRSGGLGDVALAYLMYKLATPARYTVTIGGTNLAIRYLRKEGKMKPVPHEDSLRSLYREGKEDFKRRSDVRRRRRKSRQSKRQHPPQPPTKD